MKFRPDIEGLRGIAVLLVVLAHAKLPGWSGGFVGVDIFFVISGYLITGLLDSEASRRGAIDYWAFYARRARRLAPALLVMLGLVSAFCLWALPGDLLPSQLQSSQWAALWLSNVYFAFADFDYFGAAAQDSLFLHTWSLGVEEQFYLVWPLLVAWAWRRRPGGMAWLAWLAAASLAASLLLMPVDATSAYYLMPTRLWQLALGGLVYRLAQGRASVHLQAHANWLGFAGAALLGTSLVLIDANVAYPGLWALLPALAAVALLAAGIGGPHAVGRLLSATTLRLPGRISYSWYLWHWPLLTVGPLLGLWPLGGLESVALVLLSFLVGWMSFTWVEQPLRRGVKGSPRTVVGVSVGASLLLAALLQWAAIATRPLPGAETFQQRVHSLVSIPRIYDDSRCDQMFYSAELVPCEVPAGDGSRGTLVLLGDSIGTHWTPALQVAARLRGMRLVVMTKSACAIVDEPFVYTAIHRRFTECEQWREAALAHIARTRPDMVVIGSASTYPFTPEQWREGSRRVLEALGQGTRDVVVLAPSPTLEFHAPGCVMREGRVGASGVEVDPSDCTAPLAEVENLRVIEALRGAVEATPRAHLVYLNDLVCPDGTCRAMQPSGLAFRDTQHLNASFAESLGEAVERRLPGAVADLPKR